MAWLRDISDFYVESFEEKQDAYLRAQLHIMDVPSEPMTAEGKLHIFLFGPAFDFNCCISFEENETITCTLTIPLECWPDVFGAIYRADVALLSEPGLLDRRYCWRQTAILSKEQKEILRQAFLEDIPPPVDTERQRDGISVERVIVSSGQTSITKLLFPLNNTATNIPATVVKLTQWHFSDCSLVPDPWEFSPYAYPDRKPDSRLQTVTTVGIYLNTLLRYLRW